MGTANSAQKPSFGCFGKPRLESACQERAGSKHVLVAEDNDDNADVICEMLERLGYCARRAENGQQLFQRLEDQPPDLILMDIEMPEMDGLEALRVLQADPKLRSIPVIAMSGGVGGSREQYLSVGFSEFLPKPFSLSALRATLGKL